MEFQTQWYSWAGATQLMAGPATFRECAELGWEEIADGMGQILK